MCGIAGSPNITPDVRRMLPFLAVAIERRGLDSWGASDGSQIIKRSGPCSRSFMSEWPSISQWERGIFHARGASVGDGEKASNAHPFEATYPDGRRIIGIHNGGVQNHLEIGRKYNRAYEVDSEHLWKHRAEGLPWTEFRGYANVAFFEPDEVGGPSFMKMARVGSKDLHCVRVSDGGIVFASTPDMLFMASAMAQTNVESVYTLDENVVYRMDAHEATGDMTVFRTDERLHFQYCFTVAGTTGVAGPSRLPVPIVGGGSTTGTNLPILQPHTETPRGVCLACDAPTQKDIHLLCLHCFTDIYNNWKTARVPIPGGDLTEGPMTQEEAAAQRLVETEIGCMGYFG